MSESNKRGEIIAEAVMELLISLKNDDQLTEFYKEVSSSTNLGKRSAIIMHHANSIAKVHDIGPEELINETAKALGREIPLNEDDYPSSLSFS